MKKYFSIIRIFILSLTVFLTSCVQDDVYSTPDLQGKCQDLTPTKTIAEVKTAFANGEVEEVVEIKEVIAVCFMAKYSTPNGWKQNASSPRLSTLIQKNLSPPLPTKAAGAECGNNL